MKDFDIMITDHFEVTDNIRPISEVKMEYYKFDDRLRMVVPKDKDDVVGLYFSYLNSFCWMMNKYVDSKPAYLANSGFIPLGVEPTILCGKVNSRWILPALRKHNIEYFFVEPMSPKYSSYKPMGVMSREQDIWVSKLDCAELLNKEPHLVRTFDVLEELLG